MEQAAEISTAVVADVFELFKTPIALVFIHESMEFCPSGPTFSGHYV